MNRAVTSLFSVALLGAAALAHAEPAIYQNGVLTVPQGAIFSDTREVYYTDIQMSTDTDGKLVIVGAIKMPLAPVETVDVVVDIDGVPSAMIEVSGNFPTPCHGPLLEPAVTQKGDEIIVLLANHVPTDLTGCAQVLDPFSLDIPLRDLSDLEPGTYTVRVNDVEASFELP